LFGNGIYQNRHLQVINVALGTVTSFIRIWSASELRRFYGFLENDSTILHQLFSRV